MRLALLALAGFLFTGQCRAQAPTAKWEGAIVDQKTRKPIPYAWVDMQGQKARFFADSLGKVLIEAPGQFLPDTLIGMGLGYEPVKQAFSPTATAEPLKLELPKTVIPLSNLVLRSDKAVPYTLGARSRQPGEGLIQGMPGSQFATFMKNEKGREMMHVRSAAFYIAESGQPRTKFRVRIYSINQTSGGPGRDLLLENVVVSAPRGGGWFTVDLTPYNIPAPEAGFFVAMDWLQPPNFKAATFLESGSSYGQALRPTFEFKESRTWTYVAGQGWNQLPLVNANGRAYNAMINAEVDMIK
ncbi:hypothetical protein GCM10023185_12400 [Hymenobacter saemangeumensis]|uniref:Carboxypeptidase regulatory-like domain-containing protein n=1 Tax=Hymenobacter saemangeumensis TaxID=1084522 RepID=A0ABP8I6X0_9BACT